MRYFNQEKNYKPLIFIGLSILMLLSCTTDKVDYVALQKNLLQQGFGINKVIYIVDDLESTRNYFADTLGFSLPNAKRFRESNFDGVIKTSTRFPDQSSIDFMMITADSVTENTPEEWVRYSERFEGVQSYSLSTSAIENTRDWLQHQGLQTDSIQSYRLSKTTSKEWSRDDGKAQESTLGLTSKAGYLPKFMQQFTTDYNKVNQNWNTYYIYNRNFSPTKNGVVGIHSLTLAVANFEEASSEFEKMGLEKIETSEGRVEFRIKRQQTLILETADEQNNEISDFLQERSSGVFGITFDVKNIDSTYQFFKEKLPNKAYQFDSVNRKIVIDRSFGKDVQLSFIQEPKEQTLLAKQSSIGGKLDEIAAENASKNYEMYCALCHGENREGYAADHAPSLKSHSLLASSKSSNFMRYTIQFGRANTAMGGYLDTQGGPMEYIEIEQLLQWLYEEAEVDKAEEISREPVLGDLALGETIYKNTCAVCHGKEGEGISAPALGNPMLLATATDGFLKYAIENGRDGTPMLAYKDILSEEEINSVTAFLRTRASGWNAPKTRQVSLPSKEEYILNPEGKGPNFQLREGLYVPAEQVFNALKDSTKMVILDARSTVAWRQMHIPGAVPVPYYEEPENFINDIPNDDTFIVVYCACPHAASQRVVNTLRRYGYNNTAIIDEGILVWAQMGFPVLNGE